MISRRRFLQSVAACSSFLALGAARDNSSVAKETEQSRKWLSGHWGVRFVLPGGSGATTFDASELIDGITKLQTPNWVMLNVTAPSWGGLFTVVSPNRIMAETLSFPSKDLFLDTARSLADDGYRIIAYFAAEGPDLDFLSLHRRANLESRHPKLYETLHSIEQRWDRLLVKEQIKSTQGVARYILRPVAKRYGSLISGWWFDHGQAGDYFADRAAVKSGNPDVLVAWNEKHRWIPLTGKGRKDEFLWGVKPSYKSEEFTAGDITPPHWVKPWDPLNDQIIDLLVRDARSDHSRTYHLFVPVQSNWRAGKEFFPVEKMVRWTRRVTEVGGAITWALALKAPEFHRRGFSKGALEAVRRLDTAMLGFGYPVRTNN